ncbi:RF-1 domain-containing protein [Pseudoneurospora amorphoporcata]|uniref:RF-1 domain-containing protein n=1 Tax=Pseudoneurospora amorphoporcata TaxID=241081 RepID=A0AAN6NU60_9PEZI|nr:RF-1 domain-containing protein [Pseudoneurospora amorphoporcata]
MMKTTLPLRLSSVSFGIGPALGRILKYGDLPFISGFALGSGAGRRPVIATPVCIVAVTAAGRPGTVTAAAPFTTTAASWLKAWQMPPRPKLPEDELEEVYLKGSGPGGQKINKTNSAVQLRHIPTNIVIKCQETRSRTQNRKLAREILAAKVDFHLNGDKSRVAIVGNVKKKKADSKAKKARRKYKKLEEEKAGKGGAGAGEQLVDGEEGREVEEGEEGEEWEVADAEGEEVEGHEEEIQEEANKGEEAEKRGRSADAAKQ